MIRLRLLNQTCRSAARLVSDENERPLDRMEKIGLKIHLMGCGNCRRYRHQVRLLDQLVNAAIDATQTAQPLDRDAAERIASVLSKRV